MSTVATVLVASDAPWIQQEARSALAARDMSVEIVDNGVGIADAVSKHHPDVVILDMQISNMGGFAASRELRLEAGAGRLPATKIVLLLDREADRFLADRSETDAAVLKPLNAGALRQVVRRLIAAPAKADA